MPPKTNMPSDLKHMDMGSRNARLRETLEGMGLFVTPIFLEDKSEQIDYLHVSAGAPSYSGGCQSRSQPATSSAISFPVTSPEVGDNIGAADGERVNVILFPSVT